VRIARPRDIVISALGVREGLLYSELPARERAKDGLIAAAQELNVLRSRSPEHSQELIRWTDRFMASSGLDETAEEQRLRHAACLLADIGWRAHPDYRGEQSLILIAHAALGGIDHPGRVFLALANYFRHMGTSGSPEDDGKDKLSEVVFATGAGERRMKADLLLLHQGVVPNVNLAMAAGVAHRWNSRQLCFEPVVDADFAASVRGIAVAGDGAGIAGGTAAAERGRIAAIAAVEVLKPGASVMNVQTVRQSLAREEMGRAFLDALYQPAPSFRRPIGDTIACRCEEVTAKQVRDTADLGCEGPNQMKAFLRCGMGPCQGRLCGLTVTELIAEQRRSTPEEVGYYRLRPPVKPITLAELASLPKTEAERKAVER